MAALLWRLNSICSAAGAPSAGQSPEDLDSPKGSNLSNSSEPAGKRKAGRPRKNPPPPPPGRQLDPRPVHSAGAPPANGLSARASGIAAPSKDTSVRSSDGVAVSTKGLGIVAPSRDSIAHANGNGARANGTAAQANGAGAHAERSGAAPGGHVLKPWQIERLGPHPGYSEPGSPAGSDGNRGAGLAGEKRRSGRPPKHAASPEASEKEQPPRGGPAPADSPPGGAGANLPGGGTLSRRVVRPPRASPEPSGGTAQRSAAPARSGGFPRVKGKPGRPRKRPLEPKPEVADADTPELGPESDGDGGGDGALAPHARRQRSRVVSDARITAARAAVHARMSGGEGDEDAGRPAKKQEMMRSGGTRPNGDNPKPRGRPVVHGGALGGFPVYFK